MGQGAVENRKSGVRASIETILGEKGKRVTKILRDLGGEKMKTETEVRDRLADINRGIDEATNEWTKEHLRVSKSELVWILEPADKKGRE